MHRRVMRPAYNCSVLPSLSIGRVVSSVIDISHSSKLLVFLGIALMLREISAIGFKLSYWKDSKGKY